MAAKKPIISTAIYDVVRDYKDVVTIVTNESDIKNAVDNYLNESNEKKLEREEKENHIIDNTSWDKTAGEMEKIIISSLEKNK